MNNNFREVNDDLLKDWLDFREETNFFVYYTIPHILYLCINCLWFYFIQIVIYNRSETYVI